MRARFHWFAIALGLHLVVLGADASLITRVTAGGHGVLGPMPRTPVFTPDGRYICFDALRNPLAGGAPTTHLQTYVFDRTTGTFIGVSVTPGGMLGNRDSFDPSISDDGRWVSFTSGATDLIAGDTNGVDDVFLRDLVLGVTTRISVGPGGAQSPAFAWGSSMAGDGSAVAFHSGAALAPADTNVAVDVYVHEPSTGVTSLMSIDDGGIVGNETSAWPSISRDGQRVAFSSTSTSFASGGSSGIFHVWLHDRQTGTTTLIDTVPAGGLPNGSSYGVQISADGGWVLFNSSATDLVPGNPEGGVFLRDLGAATTSRVPAGASDASMTGISQDGRFSTVRSGGTIFLYDRIATTVEVASGLEVGAGFSAPISADGRFVVFSNVGRLEPTDDDDVPDLFVLDREPPPVCTGGATIAKAQLKLSRLIVPAEARQRLTLSGRLMLPAGPPLDSDQVGAQLLVEDIGTRDLSIFELSFRTYPVPAGATGTGCGSGDGWQSGATSIRYRNLSSALDPPACTPESANGLGILSFKDRRSTGLGILVKAKGRDSFIPRPTGPLRITVVLSAAEADGLAGKCGTRVFAAAECKLRGNTYVCSAS
jgi:Tol biopolymer transport system component